MQKALKEKEGNAWPLDLEKITKIFNKSLTVANYQIKIIQNTIILFNRYFRSVVKEKTDCIYIHMYLLWFGSSLHKGSNSGLVEQQTLKWDIF